MLWIRLDAIIELIWKIYFFDSVHCQFWIFHNIESCLFCPISGRYFSWESWRYGFRYYDASCTLCRLSVQNIHLVYTAVEGQLNMHMRNIVDLLMVLVMPYYSLRLEHDYQMPMRSVIYNKHYWNPLLWNVWVLQLSWSKL